MTYGGLRSLASLMLALVCLFISPAHALQLTLSLIHI